MISNNLKKEFARFYKIPIPMIEQNFDYYLSVLDPYYGTLSKYEAFCEHVELLGGEQNFLQKLSEAKKSVINHFTQSECSDLPFINYVRSFDVKYLKANTLKLKSEVYKIPNVGHYFISIDLKQANFQAFKFLEKGLKKLSVEYSFSSVLDNINSYEELFSFLDLNPFFAQSKSARQFIFGSLEPKRQQSVQKHIMSLVANQLIYLFGNKEDITLSADEIIIKIDREQKENYISLIKQILSEDSFLTEFRFHIEPFELCRVGSQHKFFYKKKENSIEFKCVPKDKLFEVIAKYENRAATIQDKTFVHEYRTAVYQDNLFDD